MLPVRFQPFGAKDRFFRFQVEQRTGRNADDQQVIERDGHGALFSWMGRDAFDRVCGSQYSKQPEF